MGEVVCHGVGSLERGRSTDYDDEVWRPFKFSALLSPDVQFNIAPASSEPYAITTVRGTKDATSSQARPHDEALALRLLSYMPCFK
ncbi:unnamed protein product [Eruca vesicaria subsp. sativa]|uniref:Uncharacterized protein n=1 Tax=Eruca vesicaria subsp. sativa TaxID=29727 RepID=A0ABC8KCF5_ERUVS|nr:unnamed protein product [Eruca vesicaria subsp. sativa]